MEVSFILVKQRASSTKTTDLSTWELPAVPRVGEQVFIPSPEEPLSDAVSWDVVDVVHDVASGTIICYVRRTDVAAHNVALAWSAALAEPPYALPQRLDCSVVPRVGDVINLAAMNHNQLEQLEQTRELDADDYENETVETQIVVVEVRHEADRYGDDIANVADITVIVAPAPADTLPA